MYVKIRYYHGKFLARFSYIKAKKPETPRNPSPKSSGTSLRLGTLVSSLIHIYGKMIAVAIRNLKKVNVMGGNSGKAIFPATNEAPQKAVVSTINK